MNASEPSSPLGLRDRNKQNKRRRIAEAARALFIAKGFDETTTREIAARADVGMGTLFLYADNKRDLLFLIANEELEGIMQRAIAGFRPAAPVLSNLMRAFRLHYEYFGEQRQLSRYTLREMTFYDAGRQAQRFQATRERLIRLLSEIISAGQELGTIRRIHDAQLIGWVAFSIYQVELRRWLASDTPDVRQALKRLEMSLKLLLTGAATRERTIVAPARKSRQFKPAAPHRAR